jgi:integrase
MAQLTKKFIESLKPPLEEDVVIWDDELKGFGARFWPSGTVSYIVYYRNKHGRQRKISIGRHGVITPSLARKIAVHILAEVTSGNDPLADRARVRSEPTFKDLAEEYIKRRCSQKRSGAEDERIIRKDLLKPWGNLSAQEIKRRDVICLVDEIRDRGAAVMANRTLGVIKRIYNFGISRDIVEANPTAFVQPPSKEQRRDRVLSEKEIKKFWEKIDRMERAGDHAKAALKLILILGQRSGEILSMEWSEVDLDSAMWEIPGTKTKNGLPHRVPLSPLALKIIEDIDRSGAFLFPSRAGSSMREDVPMKSDALALAVRRNRDIFKLDHFTPHDLRRTAASHIASMGISCLVISKILNHVERGVTAIYDRHGYDQEKREALNAWSMKLRQIVTGKKGKIVPIRR